MSILVTPIGVVRGGREEIVEDNWGPNSSRIVLDPAELDADATLGLDEFSHIEVVFTFHLATKTRRGSSHPRGNPDWPVVGVLAGHGPMRPNHIGVSRCELISVDGLELRVRGLDAIEGTPVLDIKPYSKTFDPRGEIREPAWMQELMRDYY